MDLKLQVLLQAIDKATAPLRSITGGAGKTAKSVRDARKSLDELKKAQQNLQGFRELRSGTQKLTADLTSARQRSTALGKALAQTANPTRAQVREFNAARRAAESLEKQYQANTSRLKNMRSALAAAGINTRSLSQHEKDLRERIAATNTQLKAQEAQLGKINTMQKRIAGTRQAFERSQATAAHLAVSGYGAMETGRRVMGGLHPSIEEASRYGVEAQRVRALGLGDKASKDAINYASAMKTIGTSVTDNLQLMRDAMTIFGDEHHAEMAAPILAKVKYINEALYGAAGDGQAEANDEKFVNMLKVIELRGGTRSPEAFQTEANAVQKVLVATGGRVGPDQWREFIQRGGVAAKQLSDKSFYNGMEPLVQEMGGATAGNGLMSLYSNLYQGRSTVRAAREMLRLGLLDKDKVEYNKIGNIKQIRPGALKGGELFKSSPQEWLETTLLPALQKHGITNDGQIKDTIATIVGNRTAANLLTTMYMQRVQIHKNMRLSEGADGIDAAFSKARTTAPGAEIDLEAKKANLYRVMGQQLLPLYVAGLEKLSKVISAMTSFFTNHPTIAKGLLLVAGGFGVLATAAGGLMIAIGALIGQFALMRFAARMAGLALGKGGGGAAAEAGTGAGAGAAARIFPTMSAAARVVAGAIAGIDLPLTVLIAGLIAVGLVVHKYWEPISAFFKGVGDGIKQGLAPALDRVTQALAPLKPAWDAVVGAVKAGWHWFTQLLQPIHATKEQIAGATSNGTSFGRVLGAALARTLQMVTWGVKAFAWLGTAIVDAAGWVSKSWGPVKDWFSGMWDGVKGAAAGALEWIESKLAAVKAVIDKLTEAWQRLHGDPKTPPPIQWITGAEPNVIAPPPLRAGGGRLVHVAGDTVHMHVDARGSDPAQTQAAVHAALTKHERDKAARARSTYSDQD